MVMIVYQGIKAIIELEKIKWLIIENMFPEE